MEFACIQEVQNTREVARLSVKLVLVGFGIEAGTKFQNFLVSLTFSQLTQASLRQAFQQGPCRLELSDHKFQLKFDMFDTSWHPLSFSW